MRVAALHDASRWMIFNARVPLAVTRGAALASDANGLALVDILVAGSKIVSMLPSGLAGLESDTPFLDLAGAIVLPCFADVHTHLDKGHIWPRQPNPDGTFDGALNAVGADRAANWTSADVLDRMEFGLACAYAHGTSAMRTHIDSIGPQIGISWPIAAQLREKWQGRVELQATPLFGIGLAMDDAHMRAIEQAVVTHGSRLLGAVTYMDPALQQGLDRLFMLAADKGWNLDFHVDETADPAAHSLKLIAQTALLHKFQGRILAGHCCSLAMQGADEARRTMDLVAQAGIAIASLPMCNMYLQDRHAVRTPRWRGVTLLQELKAAGVEVMVASDNTRDPFYAYGDLDMLEVYREATRIAHLDHPHGDWVRAVSTTPAEHMGVSSALMAGGPADFILTSACDHTELLSRPHLDRRVVRGGRLLDANVPHYRVLKQGLRG